LNEINFGGNAVFQDLVIVTFDQATTVYSLFGGPVPLRHSASPSANPIVPNTGDIYEED